MIPTLVYAQRTPKVRAQGIDDILNVKRNLSLKMATIARQLRNRFDQSVAQLGVTRAHWTLIAVVGRRPGLTQRTIAETLEVTEASAGRMVDRLCKDGVLVRKPHDEDRRAYSIYLTEAAKPLLLKLGEIANANEEEAFAGISETELDKLSLLLDRIYDNMNAQRSRTKQ